MPELLAKVTLDASSVVQGVQAAVLVAVGHAGDADDWAVLTVGA